MSREIGSVTSGNTLERQHRSHMWDTFEKAHEGKVARGFGRAATTAGRSKTSRGTKPMEVIVSGLG